MKPGEYKGFTPDTSDADAEASFREQYPDAAELEIHRDDASVQVRPKQEEGRDERLQTIDEEGSLGTATCSGDRTSGQ